jgi:GTP1/Obg family GTP-binding protein
MLKRCINKPRFFIHNAFANNILCSTSLINHYVRALRTSPSRGRKRSISPRQRHVGPGRFTKEVEVERRKLLQEKSHNEAILRAQEAAAAIEYEELQKRIDPKTLQIKTWKSNRLSEEQIKYATETPALPDYLYDKYVQGDSSVIKPPENNTKIPFFPSALFPHEPTTQKPPAPPSNRPKIIIPQPIDADEASTSADSYLQQPFSGLKLISPPETLAKGAESRGNKHRITETMKLQGSNMKKAKRKITIKQQAHTQLLDMQEFLVDKTILPIVTTFPELEQLHSFDRALIRLSVTSEHNYLRVLKATRAFANRIRDLVSTETKKINQSTSKIGVLNALETAKKAILQLIMEKKEEIEKLRELAKRLHHMPIISRGSNPNNPHSQPVQSIAVIGCPNSGKSSLITRISSGKPDVQNYSFTTKSIIVGHLFYEAQGYVQPFVERELENSLENDTTQKIRTKDYNIMGLEGQNNITAVQIMDSPGLLFRPDTYRKNMELLTIASLQHLNLDIIIYLMDLSCHCGYSIAEQLTIRQEMYSRYISGREAAPVWIDVLSKVDIPINTYSPDNQFTYEAELKANKTNLDLYTDGADIHPKLLKAVKHNNSSESSADQQQKLAARQAKKEADYSYYKQFFIQPFAERLNQLSSPSLRIEEILPNVQGNDNIIFLSVSEGTGLEELKQRILTILVERNQLNNSQPQIRDELQKISAIER